MTGENFVSKEWGELPEKALKKLDYLASLSHEEYLKEVNRLGELKSAELEAEIGNYDGFSYRALSTLLPGGTGDEVVAEILKYKREAWLKVHPEQSTINTKALEGVITFSGQFVPKAKWDEMGRGERRGVLVGSTCGHFELGCAGMSDD